MILIRCWFSLAPFVAIATDSEGRPVAATGWSKMQAQQRLLKKIGVIA